MRSTRLTERSSSQLITLGLVASLAGIWLAASFGCGKPFNVKARPELPAINYASKATAASIVVEAQALTDEDFLCDTFDANLVLAGFLAVRVRLTNSSSESVDVKDARFEARSHAGRSFKTRSPREAFKRLVSYYGISVYTKAGYKESLDAFSAFALDVVAPLAAGQSREGLVFFLIPSDETGGAGLTLRVNRPGSSVVVELALK